MEILDLKANTLCNNEVMLCMRAVKKNIPKYKATNTMKFRSMEQLSTITYEILQYLENMPTVNQTSDTVTEYVREIRKFNLSQIECLMLVNMPPTNFVDLCVMVEDGDTRLTETQMEEILEVTRRHFPWIVTENNQD